MRSCFRYNDGIAGTFARYVPDKVTSDSSACQQTTQVYVQHATQAARTWTCTVHAADATNPTLPCDTKGTVSSVRYWVALLRLILRSIPPQPASISTRSNLLMSIIKWFVSMCVIDIDNFLWNSEREVSSGTLRPLKPSRVSGQAPQGRVRSPASRGACWCHLLARVLETPRSDVCLYLEPGFAQF